MANYPDLKLYVDGEWRQADDQAVVNPADESLVSAPSRHGGRAHEARASGTRLPCVSDHVRRHRSGGERQHLGRCQVGNAGQVCVSPTASSLMMRL